MGVRAFVERVDSGAPRPRVAAASHPVHGLQGRIGNAGVASLVARLQRVPEGAADDIEIDEGPTWSPAQTRPIQQELRRLGLYTMAVDGDLGPGTAAALVEAFGDDGWRSLDADEALDRLREAVPPDGGGARGEHSLRYGELFRDGLLDITVGVGFTEEVNEETGNSYMADSLAALTNGLPARGFERDDSRGTELLRDVGRDVRPGAFGDFYVKEPALTYQPPAGDSRDINGVVRVVSDLSGGEGAEAAAAYREGMAQSDVSAYMGHGRYGTGPDFDGIFRMATLYDDDGAVERATSREHELESWLIEEGRPAGRGPWEQFRHRLSRDAIEVEPASDGNVLLSARAQGAHRNEFGGRLTEWLIQESGATSQAGAGGDLQQEAAAAPDKRYRVMLFDGCNTDTYETAIRSTPGFSTGTTEAFETRRAVMLDQEVAAALAFLDGVLGRQSPERMIRNMDAALAVHLPGDPAAAVVRTGGRGDPVVR